MRTRYDIADAALAARAAALETRHHLVYLDTPLVADAATTYRTAAPFRCTVLDAEVHGAAATGTSASAGCALFGTLDLKTIDPPEAVALDEAEVELEAGDLIEVTITAHSDAAGAAKLGFVFAFVPRA